MVEKDATGKERLAHHLCCGCFGLRPSYNSFVHHQRKNVMQQGCEPLSERESMNDSCLQCLRFPDRMPSYPVILVSEKGRIEKKLIKLVIEHITRYVRNFVPDSLSFCLTRDSHSSPEGAD